MVQRTRSKKKPRQEAPLATGNSDSPTPVEKLNAMSKQALDIARTARRNRVSLQGANFYADKMANLRADATNAFREVDEKSLGDASALAELMETIFSPHAKKPKDRAEAARNLQIALKTAVVAAPKPREDGGIFPLVKLEQTGRGYLVRIGRQINGAHAAGWYDACAVMMRRLLETVIIEAFEAKNLAANIKDTNGDFFMLTKLVGIALAESWNLGRNVKKELPDLKDAGHKSAHSRYYVAEKDDIDKIAPAFREAVEAFLHISGLLKQ
jgi:hypothetical protein